MKIFIEHANTYRKRIWNENKKIMIFLLCVYVVALFPLLRGNINYRDDYGRVLWAFDGWDNFGRVTTNTLAHIVHGGTYIKDISPIPQVIALLLTVLSSIALLKIVCEKRKATILDGLSVIPLGLFPYFLCCFSYKFDAPYMALSVFVSIIPLLVRKNQKIYYPLVVICTLLMCTTYQASAGILPMLVVYTAFSDWKNGEALGKVVRYCFFSALSFLGAMVFFFLFVPKGESGYVTEIVSFNSLSVGNVVSNYISYIATFKVDFSIKWFLLIAGIGTLFVARNVLSSQRKPIWTVLLSGISCVLMLLLAFGPYPFLDEPFLMPRGMYGIGVLISVLCVGCTVGIPQHDGKVHKSMKMLAYVCVIALSWLCIVFSCEYGNSLVAQRKYDDFRIEEVVHEISDIPQIDGAEPMQLQILGNTGYAAGIKNIPSIRVIYRLIPAPFGEENYWSYLPLLSYYNLPPINYTEELSQMDYSKWSVYHENCHHKIYVEGNKVLILLKNPS